MSCGCNKNNTPRRVTRTQANHPDQNIKTQVVARVVTKSPTPIEAIKPVHNYSMVKR